MRIAYLTIDDANEDLAVQMADECGTTLCPLAPGDWLPAGRFDAVLYDWDSLPPHQRQEALLTSLAGPPSCPVAVHGCTLDGDEAEALRQDGVAVFPRLEPVVFRLLRRLAGPKGHAAGGKRSRRREPALSGY